MRELRGKVAVVTGAASGIGLGLAHHLGATGCRLSLADLDGPALDGAAQSLTDRGFEVLTTRTDVSRLEEVERLAERTLARFGSADLVVNNAGVTTWNPVDASTIGDWRWVIDVNLWGVIHGVHVFLPVLERQGGEGHIVNVSSVGGILADAPYMAAYSATKAGVIGLSLTLASELRLERRPIGVTIVCPSATREGKAHLAERNRPAALPPLQRTAGAQALFDRVSGRVEHGQTVATLARRVVDGIRNDELWVFPHPEAAPLLRPRLEALQAVLDGAAGQPVND